MNCSMENPRISFIGAGSYGFTFKLMVDIMNLEALKNSEFVFMDVDDERLKNLKVLINEFFRKNNFSNKTVYTTNMETALKNTNFVINTVKIGFLSAAKMDLKIPQKFRLYQSIGDTSGVAGVFRGLRTMVFCNKMLKMIEKVSSPDAVVLNYTNPQAMLVMYANQVSSVPFIGLCHSVQGTTGVIARYLNVEYEELNYESAGINHMSWITKLEVNGKDLYPRFRKQAKKHGIHWTCKNVKGNTISLGPTRLDMLNRTGYVVTESSHHFAEYVPYYLRTKELAEKYEVIIDKHISNTARKEKRYMDMVEQAKEHKLPDIESSFEYAPLIINSMVTNNPVKIYGNFMNDGLITNLPEFSAVEVKSLIDRNGFNSCYYGELPTHLAALNAMEINVHQLAVKAILECDRSYVYWALMMDPLTHSVLDIDQIESVVDELIDKQQEYLGGYL